MRVMHNSPYYFIIWSEKLFTIEVYGVKCHKFINVFIKREVFIKRDCIEWLAAEKGDWDTGTCLPAVTAIVRTRAINMILFIFWSCCRVNLVKKNFFAFLVALRVDASL